MACWEPVWGGKPKIPETDWFFMCVLFIYMCVIVKINFNISLISKSYKWTILNILKNKMVFYAFRCYVWKLQQICCISMWRTNVSEYSSLGYGVR